MSDGWFSFSQAAGLGAAEKILKHLDKSWIKGNRLCQADGSPDAEDGVIGLHRAQKTSVKGFKTPRGGTWTTSVAQALISVWFDEETAVRNIPREVRVLRQKKGQIFGDDDAALGLCGLTTVQLVLETTVWCCFYEWADNPWLVLGGNQRLTEFMPEGRAGKQTLRKIRFDSDLFILELDLAVHVIDPDVPFDWQDMPSIDPLPNNLFAAIGAAINGDGVVLVVAEHSGERTPVARRAHKEISAQLNWHTTAGQDKRSYRLGSQPTHAGCLKVRVRAVFRAGINVNARVTRICIPA